MFQCSFKSFLLLQQIQEIIVHVLKLRFYSSKLFSVTGMKCGDINMYELHVTIQILIIDKTVSNCELKHLDDYMYLLLF